MLVQYIILFQFNKASTQAPGVDLYAPLPAGDWSILALETGGMITDYCLPASLARWAAAGAAAEVAGAVAAAAAGTPGVREG